MRNFIVGVVWIALMIPAAEAAPPSPDRPTESATASLVAPGTLELEAGVAWRKSQFSAPLLLKYSVKGWFEPRIGVDAHSLSGNAPDLSLGFKVKCLKRKQFALAVYAATTLPVRDESPKAATVRLLLDVAIPKSPVFVGVNVGANVTWDSDAAFDGVPLSFVVGAAAHQRLSVFLEGALTLFGDELHGVVDVGAGFLITPRLMVDLNVGWDLKPSVPFVNVGLTLNMGK